jgi:hypothetical protein
MPMTGVCGKLSLSFQGSERKPVGGLPKKPNAAIEKGHAIVAQRWFCLIRFSEGNLQATTRFLLQYLSSRTVRRSK